MVGNWLIQNAKHITKEIFTGSRAPWRGLTPFHVLAMRAVTPAGVFTPEYKPAYLDQIQGNGFLSEIADVIFASDHRFLSELPVEWTGLRSQLIQLMQLAYRRGIRVPDLRVSSM